MVRLMFASLRTMFWGCVLLFVTLTLWSIVFVELLHPLNKDIAATGYYGTCTRCPYAYEDVYQSILTLLDQFVFGNGWGSTAAGLIEYHPWTGVILVMAGVCVDVGLMNLILTVIVDKAHEQHEQDEIRKLKAKEKLYEEAKTRLYNICSIIDDDGSGTITLEELEDGFNNNAEFALALSVMDIKADDMGIVFSILDEDLSGSVTYEEFVDQLYKMKSQDSQTMLLFIKGYVNELRQKLTESLRLLKTEVSTRITSLLDNQATMKENQERMKANQNKMLTKDASKDTGDPSFNDGDAAGDGGWIPPQPTEMDAVQKIISELNKIDGKMEHQLQQTSQMLGQTSQMLGAIFQSTSSAERHLSKGFLASCSSVESLPSQKLVSAAPTPTNAGTASFGVLRPPPGMPA